MEDFDKNIAEERYKRLFFARAGFLPRALAFVVDSFFIWIIFGIVINFTGTIKASDLAAVNFSDEKEIEAVYDAIAPLAALISLTYFGIEIAAAASPGKFLLGLRIRDEAGYYPKTSSLAARYLLKNVGNAFSALYFLTSAEFFEQFAAVAGSLILVGFLLTLGVRKQALHDLPSGTAVFKSKALKEIENLSQ